jgi:cysteinyl-tRNA synthetase
LEEASDRVYYLLQTLLDAREALRATADPAGGADRDLAQAEAELARGEGPAAQMLRETRQALNDDLNTPQVVSLFSAPLKTINDLLTTKAGKKRPDRRYTLHAYSLGITRVLELLGLDVERPEDVLRELGLLALTRTGLDEQFVLDKIKERVDARAAKDFAKADLVRRTFMFCHAPYFVEG